MAKKTIKHASADVELIFSTFYADWFVDRWKAGYVKWKNSFK
jgi:hypothetical protein